MNKLTRRIIEVILGLALLLLFSASALAQDQPPPPEAGQISAPLRSAAYPEALYSHGIVPDWDRGYVIHSEIEMNHSPDTPMVVMYDNTESESAKAESGRRAPAAYAFGEPQPLAKERFSQRVGPSCRTVRSRGTSSRRT